MSSEQPQTFDEAPVIYIDGVGKSYSLYQRPTDRLLQFLRPHGHQRHTLYVALKDVSFSMRRGEVLGIVGVNGAGKSTLLQLVAGIIPPTRGQIQTRGRVASILELGAGFNPEFTGRENVYLNAATMGLTKSEIDRRLKQIIDFAGIGQHIDQPVKTYSSGMLVRLAFSVACSVEPDILIIDEALSVGDGAFRRRSFDRIMDIKSRGTTILFCSHVLFHVETFCDRAIWLHRGRVVKAGAVADVIEPYQAFLDVYEHEPNAEPENVLSAELHNSVDTPLLQPPAAMPPAVAVSNTLPSAHGEARLEKVLISLDGASGTELRGRSLHACLDVHISFASDPALPAPTAALVISSHSGKILGSCSSLTHGQTLQRDAQGRGHIGMSIRQLPLNRGKYRIGVYLFCERGLHGYAMLDPAATLEIDHAGPEQGPLILQPQWSTE